MYNELVKRLRYKAGWDETGVFNEAADSIEELQGKYYLMKKTAEWLAEKVPKWIPVTERLPDEREWVLCQCRAKIRMVLRLQNGYWHQDSQHEFMSGFVTHWMPLPDPPTAEEGE